MSDGVFPDRLIQLRNRWEADPSSRIFLQLAEEYRHQGRIREALDVLERGLKEHPGYLSALVAKGRCLIELGEPEPAREVLERVVKQDATQMVAIKLLVRAYLETGDPERARERLDLYTLLNDSDPEIEELRRRLQAMEQPPQAETAPAVPSPRQSASDDIFDLGAPAAPPRQDDPFADIFAAPAPAAPAPKASAVAAPGREEPETEDVLFPGLSSRESRQRYLSALSAEGLFAFEPPPEPPAPPPAEPEPVPAVFELEVEEEREAPVELDLVPEPEPAWAADAPTMVWKREETVELVPAVPEPPVFEMEELAPLAEEPAAAAPAGPPATVTLGDLYLRQGHPGEAARIFQEVLRREPDNPAALEGLARVEERRREKRPLEVRDLMAGYEPGPEGGEAEVRSRKAFLLSNYLKRLRSGG